MATAVLTVIAASLIAASAIDGLATEGVSALASLSAYRLPMATTMGDAGGSGIELWRRGVRIGGAVTGLASAGIRPRQGLPLLLQGPGAVVPGPVPTRT